MLAPMRRLLWLTLLLLTALPFLAAAGLAVRSGWVIDVWGLLHRTGTPGDDSGDPTDVQAWAIISHTGKLGFRRERATGTFTEGAFIAPGRTEFHHSESRVGKGQRGMSLENARAIAAFPAFSEHINLIGLQAYSESSKRISPPAADAGSSTSSSLVVPFWWSLPLLSLPPLLTLLLYRRSTGRRLIREGRCAGCGYDLRGSPGRCPECGRAAGATHATIG